MGQGCVKLGKGVGIHLVHHRTSGQAPMDNIYGRFWKFPWNFPTIALPAAGVFTARHHRRLLLQNLCVVLPSDLSGKPVDVLVLGLLQEFYVRSVILNGQISVAHLTGRPDGILQQVILYKATQLFTSHPYKESEHIARIFLAKESEILLVTFLIEPIRETALLQIAVEIIQFDPCEIVVSDFFHNMTALDQDLLPGSPTKFCRIESRFSGRIFLFYVGLKYALDQDLQGIFIHMKRVTASFPNSNPVHAAVPHTFKHQVHHMARDEMVGDNGSDSTIRGSGHRIGRNLLGGFFRPAERPCP